MSTAKIVGLGAVSPSGLTKEDLFQSVRNSESNINRACLGHEAEGLAVISQSNWSTLLAESPEPLKSNRCTQISAWSLSAALKESKWTASQIAEAGFVFSSTTSQISQWEEVLFRYLEESANPEQLRAGVQNQSLGAPMLALASHFDLRGPRSLITSSCSASLQALAVALFWIRSKKVKRCLVGATELHSNLTRVGFQSLRLLSPKICRPFDKNRGGINLGEASAFLCLEADDQEPPAWGYLAGAGLSTDAFHATSPDPSGQGSRRALEMALASAQVKPEQIGWIYAHGTGSIANDASEAKAVQQTFQNSSAPQPWLSGTKAIHGHTLAASGALESVLGLMAMQRNEILGTFMCEEPDPSLSVRIALETKTLPSNESLNFFIKNSLGFGGINASLVFSKNGSSQ
jgi:3-oxoacyl-[acyl-carrier-protein] synthase II